MKQTPKEFKLIRIELYNVFNYRGRHTIDFSTDRPGNIFLFNIQNGGGKTSLFLAIKWGFYGRDSGIEYVKDGVRLTNRDFMNQDEREEGSFRVRITFEYDGKEMELRRECPDYRSEDTVLTLKVGGMMERDNVAKTHIAQIIPPDYGDFFMFNGEVLQEIANNQRDVRKTDGVLKLLGLKQLNDLKEELSSIQRTMTSEFSRMSGAGDEFKRLTGELERLSEKYDRWNTKLDKDRKSYEQLQNEIRELEEERRRYANVQGTIDKLESLKKDLRSDEEKQRYVTEYIRNHSENAFVIFLEDDIDAAIKRIEEKKDELIRANRLMPSGSSGKYLEAQEDILTKHLEECPVCRAAVTPETIVILNEMIKQSAGVSRKYSENQRLIRELNGHIEFLKDRKALIPKDLNRKCTELFDLSESIIKLNAEIQHLNEIASNSDVEKVKEISTKLGNLYTQRSKLTGEISKGESMLSNTEKNLRIVRNKINNSKDLNSQQVVVSYRMNYLDRLIKRLDTVIRNASIRKRKDILVKADNVFMDITNKPDIYKGLEYDDNVSFAMHIVRRDGNTVLNPSSGEKHVLAISFLISLSLNTERLNPMMMDTPLSRLDVVHKKNIGTALSHLGNQVIFLAQPGEMDPETLRCFIPSVAKMFEAAPDEDNGACIMEVPL